jgi:hypothetical protein
MTSFHGQAASLSLSLSLSLRFCQTLPRDQRLRRAFGHLFTGTREANASAFFFGSSRCGSLSKCKCNRRKVELEAKAILPLLSVILDSVDF